MFHWLTALVDWIFGRQTPFTQLSLRVSDQNGAARRERRGPNFPHDPRDFDSRVREPLRRGPTGRGASVAVHEPEDDERCVVAIGTTADDDESKCASDRDSLRPTPSVTEWLSAVVGERAVARGWAAIRMR